MWEPRISDLISQLAAIQKQHGDLVVQGFAQTSDTEYPDVDAEYNGDTGPVCLLTLATGEDD